MHTPRVGIPGRSDACCSRRDGLVHIVPRPSGLPPPEKTTFWELVVVHRRGGLRISPHVGKQEPAFVSKRPLRCSPLPSVLSGNGGYSSVALPPTRKALPEKRPCHNGPTTRTSRAGLLGMVSREHNYARKMRTMPPALITPQASSISYNHLRLMATVPHVAGNAHSRSG